MPERLRKLVYLSHATIQDDVHVLTPTIEEILAISRRNNASAEITGALMFNQGYFAQVLEGTQRALEATFERIQMDERHDRVAILAYDEVSHRVFESWSMGWVGEVKSESANVFATLSDEADRQTREIAGERIYALLQRRLREGGL